MSNLQPLVWHEQQGWFSTKSPLTEYQVALCGERYRVLYTKRSDGFAREATGFATVEDAKEWAWNHYNEKMQPYVKQLNLATAVNALVDACHGASVKGGWWHDIATGEPIQRNKLEMIALIHSEISEAVEGVRKGINDDHLPGYPMEDVEMADALIRIFDYIGGHNLQTADALVDKLAYNANRADHKPENRVKDGGKKY